MQKENKALNLCEKLAGCSAGMKLWSPLLGNCWILKIRKDSITVGNEAVGLHSFDKHGHYSDSSEECLLFPSKDNRDWDNWECPKPKVERFDPETLQPFDKVLVRDDNSQKWKPALFAWFDLSYSSCVVIGQKESPFWCAVPYNEDTKHLLGTKDEASEFYRWWEDEA